MSFFSPELPKKEKKESHHPWEKTIKPTYANTYKYGHNSANNPLYPTKKKDECYKNRYKLTVIGNRVTKEFIFCYYLARLLYKYRRKQFEAPVIRGVSGVEWPKVWNDLKLQYGDYAFCIDCPVAVLVNDQFLGGDKELKKFVGSKYIYHLCIDYYTEGLKQFAKFINSCGRPCVYMQFCKDSEEIGTMIFMLYADIVPQTCQNFLRLCDTTKGGYAGTPVHRIVDDGWIQCGGFALRDNPDLDCENFIVQHDRRGVLCMANSERHVDCSTQFFVLLQPAPWMAHKYVAFGQLIEGEGTLRKIEKVPTWYESPTADIRIFKCGIFNMDCHWVPINKNTHEYIHSHIENLLEIGEIFYAELIERVFLEAEFKLIQQLEPPDEEIEVVEVEEEIQVEGEVKHVHETKRFRRRKSENKKGEKETTEKHKPEVIKDIKEIKKLPQKEPVPSVSGATTENKDFDVDEYKYEFEEYSYSQVTPPSSEVIIKPEKPFYIPLTDVPYPGEVESTYNLQKLLRGDFCHETDLEKDPVKRVYEKQRRVSIPETLLCALFECFTEDDSSDSSLDSEDEAEIKDYLKENGDSASFAGRIIKKMANIPKKYAIFDEEKKMPTKNLLSDDELRIIRMAEHEYKTAKKKKVSISLAASKLSHMKIQRRATGYVRMADLATLHGINSDTFEPLEESDSDGENRRVRVVGKSTSETRRSTFQGLSGPRPSVLARLFVDVRMDDDDGPTLKDYRPSSDHKSFALITKSDTHQLFDDSRERMLDRHAMLEPRKSIDHVLRLQYGNKISRKISYDYVGTIKRMEHKAGVSIRSLEFAKKRPSMSVLQYKRQNKLYREQMLNQEQNIVKGRVGLRLPGDSPLYLSSKDDIRKRKSYIAGRVPW